jgi:hypothetical protein
MRSFQLGDIAVKRFEKTVGNPARIAVRERHPADIVGRCHTRHPTGPVAFADPSHDRVVQPRGAVTSHLLTELDRARHRRVRWHAGVQHLIGADAQDVTYLEVE